MSAPSDRRSPAPPTHRLHAVAGLLLAGALAALTVGCGDNIRPAADAGPPDAPVFLCGDGQLDPGEDCDDGNFDVDMVCDDHCGFTCGNGVVNPMVGELCDTAIPAGTTGACPATCSDGVACTSDVRSGSDCQVMCSFEPITARVPGDGCCPAGANSTNDSDCPVACGNGVLEAGERCDTTIPAGMPGACPTTCSDGAACTTDVLMGQGTCAAQCMNPPITMPMNNDGCCPPGATPALDNDCVPGCGNGVVDPGETCDTGIPVGPGSCNLACSDGMVCTRDVIVNPGTCIASCSFPNITMPMSGDGCCPAGANSTNDNDCPPRCGNGVLETGEQCDDGNTNNTDGCSNTCTLPPTAFRMGDLDLRDPHVFYDALGCRDLTDTPFFGFAVNPQIQTQIQTDGDGDGVLDLSPTLVFRPLAQGTAGQLMELHFARCTAPLGTTTCRAGVMPPVVVQTTNMAAGTCLAPTAGTTHTPPYTPGITSATAPCFVSAPASVTITLSGIPVPLRDARIAATYSGNPAQVLLNGLLVGFITEADANATILPSTLPLVGGQPFSVLLPGGDPPGPAINCAAFSDKDMNNGTPGWWFYLNYAAARVPWTGN